MPLNDSQCRNNKPNGKVQKLSDGGGLYLHITPSGQKYWRMKYRFAGKEKLLSFGVYPIVTLAEARTKRDETKKLLSENIDPSMVKKTQKQALFDKNQNNFERVAREWHATQETNLTPDYWKNKLHRLEIDIFPEIGSYPIEDIKAPHILMALKKIEKRGANEIARRDLQMCSQIFRYAVSHSYCSSDPTLALKGALQPVKQQHFASIEINDLPDLIRKIERNENRLFPTTIHAIKLMMLTFVRTGELIGAK